MEATLPRTSGIYTLPPGYQAVTGELIVPSQHNPPLEDIAQALTDSLPRDGSAPMTGNLAMNGNKITNIAAATSAGNVPRYDQVAKLTDDNTYTGNQSFEGDLNVDVVGNSVFFDADGAGRTAMAFTNKGTQYGLVNITAANNINFVGQNGGAFFIDGASIVTGTRTIATGDGLTGGGNLGSDRTISVTSDVARRSGGNTFSGTQNVTGALQVSGVDVVDENRTISTGDGLLGGGNLSANRTLTVSNTVARRHVSNTFNGTQNFEDEVNIDVNNSSLFLNADGSGRVAQVFTNNGTQYGRFEITSSNNVNFVGQNGGRLFVDGSSVVNGARTISSGSGLTGGGNLGSDRTISMGTPSSITSTSTNEATGGTHTHSLSSATVRVLIADSPFGAVGTYAFLRRTTPGAVVPGNNYSGASLNYAAENGTISGTDTTSIGGTWMAMGGASGAETWATQFLRLL